jgi:lipopolysaccharide transport system ATP-binding protein
MSNIVISVENISKQYRLGQVGTGTLSHDLNRWWSMVRGKEDPYLKIGETNDRTSISESQYVWALRDINFNVKHGEVLGIIGRNGAGKSTLLKILSRTTAPTTGKIKIKGRIASLLEVGTGFHPELSGKDNIFQNGAILGMKRHEIKRKFDEIVDFAGVSRYIDTPVKRYSSGMYVRLAFAVAAHLEPEILVVDEVLAVGDAEFQKKCLGKMKDVSEKEGRTVLFVSHNMAAVKGLCTMGIILENGRLTFTGNQNEAVSYYQSSSNITSGSLLHQSVETAPGNDKFRLLKLDVISAEDDFINIESGFVIDVRFYNYISDKTLGMSVFVVNEDELIVFEAFSLFADNSSSKEGLYEIQYKVPGNLLNAGRYYLNIVVAESQKYKIWQAEKIVSFDIENTLKGSGYNLNKVPGVLRPELDISVNYTRNV